MTDASHPAEMPPHSANAPHGTLDYSRGAGSTAELPALGRRGYDAVAGMGGWVMLFAVLIFIGSALAAIGALFMLIAGVIGLASGASGGGGEAAGGGAVMIVMGLVYAAFVALMFMPGLYLHRSSSAVGRLKNGGGTEALDDFLVNMKSYWKFLGVLTLCYFGFIALMFLLAVGGAGIGALL